mmetsp:Transcript_32908/g.54150  ORF Transcript_32908/g.54150 Transcript_32908/m.54150 type:complete len:352 (-) Transcript_32908:72-1127(-)
MWRMLSTAESATPNGTMESRTALESRTAPATEVYDEEAILRQGPLTTFRALSNMFLEFMGVEWHRRERSSRTYRALRHCCYSGFMTHTILITIFVHCYLFDNDPTCGILLKVWAAGTCGGILHHCIYRCIGLICIALRRQDCGCNARNLTRPTTGCMVTHHVVAAVLTVSLLFIIIAALSRSGAAEFKAFVLFFVACSVVLCVRWSKHCFVHLVQLERCARRAERRAFRERLSNNVLTIAEILEVRRTSTTEQDALAVLEQQPVMQYDREALGDHTECCICSVEFDASTELRRIRCGHVFHSACLGDWLERSLTCPLCREDLAICQPNQPHEELAEVVGARQVEANLSNMS